MAMSMGVPCAARRSIRFTIRISGGNLFDQSSRIPSPTLVYFQQLNLSKDFRGGRKHGPRSCSRHVSPSLSISQRWRWHPVLRLPLATWQLQVPMSFCPHDQKQTGSGRWFIKNPVRPTMSPVVVAALYQNLISTDHSELIDGEKHTTLKAGNLIKYIWWNINYF